MNYKYILFDLDGTLTDPKLGITKAVAYALNKMKNLEVDIDDLTKFIGPPLKDSFMTFYDFTEKEAEQAISYFREYYQDKGIFENFEYKGVKELLEFLKTNKHTLAVATSKPTFFANTVLKHFNLDKYFDCIVGSNLDNTRTNKAEIIEEVLSQLTIIQKEKVIMIGDRKHDILGANKTGIDSIGVEYGYGSLKELEDAGATYIAKNLNDLKNLLNN